jgi:hypothetical protein
MVGVIGAAFKGFGKALAKGKKAKLKTVYRPKKGIYIEQFKKSKKHGLKDKIGVWTNREAAVAIEQAGKGVTMKFKKSGMPYVKTGTKPSMLTKAKGLTKLVAPLAGAVTAGTIHGEIKAKQKSKKK